MPFFVEGFSDLGHIKMCFGYSVANLHSPVIGEANVYVTDEKSQTKYVNDWEPSSGTHFTMAALFSSILKCGTFYWSKGTLTFVIRFWKDCHGQDFPILNIFFLYVVFPNGYMSYCLQKLVLLPSECDLSISPQENLNKNILTLHLAVLCFLLKLPKSWELPFNTHCVQFLSQTKSKQKGRQCEWVLVSLTFGFLQKNFNFCLLHTYKSYFSASL